MGAHEGQPRPIQQPKPVKPNPRQRAAEAALRQMTDIANLARDLTESGEMTEDWAKAFHRVPRSSFLPDLMWPLDDDGSYHVADRRLDPADWNRWAYANVPITTQWDDGHHTGRDPGEEPTSSGSMPAMVFAMFRDLDVHPGMTVLEVGTGTGWCAGLLSARLGDDAVTSVEVDAGIAEAARAALKAAGWAPEVITGDGAAGWPSRAPYDRLLATVGVREIPAAWPAQVRAGGVIVAPWGTGYSQQDAIARLVVADDGTAAGRFTSGAGFMKLRAQRNWFPNHEDYLPGGVWPADLRESRTSVGLEEVQAAEWVIGVHVPQVTHTIHDGDEGMRTLLLYGLDDRSWAAAFFCDDGCTEFLAYQGGPRSLWDEVEAAHRWWVGAGRPDVTRFGLTVSPDGQRVWLDSPES